MKVSIKKNKNNDKKSNKETFREIELWEIQLALALIAYKIFLETFKKFVSVNQPKNPLESHKFTAGDIPATGHDIYNYVARYGMANFKIQIIMKLDGKLEPDKLLRAVRLSLDAEPIFGCHLVQSHPPYWRPIADLDTSKICSFEENANLDEAIQKCLESPLDMDNDPMIKLHVISSGPQDTLCMKINHSCCDGTGTKEYIKLLSDIYACIEGDKEYVPKPSIRNRQEQDILFRELGITDPEASWDHRLEIPKTLWPFPWLNARRDMDRIAISRLPEGYIEKLYTYGKTREAKLNDIILTAFYRAMFEMTQPPCGIPMDIASTVDLRRYLPNKKTVAIRNFSGGFDTKIARVADEPFEGTLARVVAMMNEIKKGRPGLQSAIGLERIERANFHETIAYYKNAYQFLGFVDKCAPVMSNLGFIDDSIIKFGKVSITDAYIVPPAISAPGILLCVSSYNGILTLAISYYRSQVQREDIERLLELIKKELIECC